MHQAYDVHSILRQVVQIESITAYDNNVILGTRSGQLIMYSVDKDGVVGMPMFNKYFSKKPIAQMEVIPKEFLLFVLTDGIINICDISRMENNFIIMHSSQATKGCNIFALDIKVARSTTGETTTVIRVCCAIKRRLQIFYWKANALASPDFSIELKDIPKALCWIDDLICIGYKDEYVLYNIKCDPPEKHDLIVTSSSHSMDPCICLLKQNTLGVSKDEYFIAIDLDKYLQANDDKKSKQGTIESASTESKPLLKPMVFSSLLLATVWDEPYVVGRVANGLEIRCLDRNSVHKDTLIQTISQLSKTKYLIRSGPGIIFAAGISELWCIRMIDIKVQRQQLLQQKKFNLAIDLTNVSNEPDKEKSDIIRQIHMLNAKELFVLKQFPAAMCEFTKASADPYEVIRLFPNLVQDPNGSKVNTIELEEKDLENALLALIEFLALARQKEVVKIRDSKHTSKSLLSIIDTTLLKCYLQTNDSLIAPLLRLNQCHFEETEKTLIKHDKISELIILYQTNNKHRKALELLKTQTLNGENNVNGYERTIRYLQQLGSSQIQLIFDFSDWILCRDPEKGLRIFTEDFIEVENLPRARVLDFFLKQHKSLVIPYLEHVINNWHDKSTFLHNVLIKQYLDKVQCLSNDIKKNDLVDDKNETELQMEMEKYREKLYTMLKNSNNYSPEIILKDFPTSVMLEERALILERLKEHQKVLIIYVQILGDINKAMQYCDAKYNEDPNIFITLLKILLNPTKTSPYDGVDLHTDFQQPNHDIIVDVLNKYPTKIDASAIWEDLPRDMPLHRLKCYLDTVLRTKLSERHNLIMKRALLQAEVSRVEGLICEQQNTHFELTEFSVCLECRKRFTNQSAFVRYPTGEVVHLSCHDKKIMAANLFGS